MSALSVQLMSANEDERREGWRFLVDVARQRAGVLKSDLGKRLGRGAVMMRYMLEEERNYHLRLADVGPLIEAVGIGWLEEGLRSLGLRLVKAVEKAAPADVLAAVATVIRECSEATAKAAESLRDGVLLPSEAAAISQEVAEARRALNQLEASVAVAASKVVEMGSRR